ncbi:MAG: M1 family metallopeptidase, partial [Ignavibacteriaceae bacterium]
MNLRLGLLFFLLLTCSIFINAQVNKNTIPPEHHAPNREFYLLNIILNLRFDLINKKLLGEATETLIPLRMNCDSLHLDAVDMKILNIKMNGKDLQYKYDGKELTVALDKYYNINDTLTYVINYTTVPKSGVYFILPDSSYPNRVPQIWSQSEMEDARYWFPCHDYPDDFLTSSVTATVPEDWTVISNGYLEKVNDDPATNQKTFYWVEDKPHVIYLISIVAGKYSEIKSKFGEIPVDYYIPADQIQNAKENFSSTPDILKFYSDVTGQIYPWNKLSLTTVSDFTFGGMENVSAITLTDGTLHKKFAEPQVSSVSLIAHETAHQWFGDFLTCRNWSNAWLNEGFATFFEALYTRHAYGKDEFNYEMRQKRKAVINADNQKRIPTVYNRYNYPVELFSTYIYPRGAAILNMMRGILGDSLFFKSIRHYVQKFKHQNVDTHNFKNAIQEATGENLYWFFDEWLFKAGHPKFDVSYRYNAHKLLLTVKQTQKVDSLTPVFRLPVDIYIVTPSQKLIKKIRVDSLENSYSFDIPEKPLMVNFDENNLLLKELKFDKSEDELIYQLKNDPNVDGRIRAAGQLSKLKNESAVQSLIEAMIDAPFYGVRQECAAYLSNFTPDNEIKEALISALNDHDLRVVEAAIMTLGKYKEDDVFEKLQALYTNSKNYFVKAAIVSSIASIDPAKAQPIIKNALNSNSYNNILAQAGLRTLAKINPEKAFNTALKFSKYGQPNSLRLTAARMIVKLDT